MMVINKYKCRGKLFRPQFTYLVRTCAELVRVMGQVLFGNFDVLQKENRVLERSSNDWHQGLDDIISRYPS